MAVTSNRRWIAFVVGREALLLGFCFLGSWLFLNHGLLYLQPRTEIVDARLQAYALTTAVIYIFIRGISLVVEIRLPPRTGAGTGHRWEQAIPLDVKPVRRNVATQDRARSRPAAVLLRNAVVSAQAAIPPTGVRAPTPLSALTNEHPGPSPLQRPKREPWRPPWMAEPPRRR
jgi:hypothetical protein